MTRFPVSALRSVDLGTPDLGRSERFYVMVWGLELVARHNGVVYLRAGGCDHHVVALHHSARPELRAVTFRVASADDFTVIAGNVIAQGGQVISPPAANEAPDGGTVMIVRGPEGGLLRFVHGDTIHAAKFPGLTGRSGSPMSTSTASMPTRRLPSTRRRLASASPTEPG